MYSKNKANYNPDTMQNGVQNELKPYSNAKGSPKIMQSAVKNECKRCSPTEIWPFLVNLALGYLTESSQFGGDDSKSAGISCEFLEHFLLFANP